VPSLLAVSALCSLVTMNIQYSQVRSSKQLAAWLDSAAPFAGEKTACSACSRTQTPLCLCQQFHVILEFYSIHNS
jgi:hypothetical protein